MTKLFNYAMDIGEQMLLSGAEVHRVEESISLICYAFGAKRVDVFIITSSMVVTIQTLDGETYTQLYEKADKAMYSVKRNGKDGYAFNE